MSEKVVPENDRCKNERSFLEIPLSFVRIPMKISSSTFQRRVVNTRMDHGKVTVPKNKKAQTTVVLSVLYLRAPSNATSAEAEEWLKVVGKRNGERTQAHK